MAGKTSRKGKGYYATYKAADIFRKNREKGINRHLKDNPNDKQAQEALKAPASYSRSAPKSRKWDSSSRFMAQMERVMKGFWNAVASGQIEKPEPDPRYVNWGMDEPKAQQPEVKTKSKRNRRPKKKEAA